MLKAANNRSAGIAQKRGKVPVNLAPAPAAKVVVVTAENRGDEGEVLDGARKYQWLTGVGPPHRQQPLSAQTPAQQTGNPPVCLEAKPLEERGGRGAVDRGLPKDGKGDAPAFAKQWRDRLRLVWFAAAKLVGGEGQHRQAVAGVAGMQVLQGFKVRPGLVSFGRHVDHKQHPGARARVSVCGSVSV